MRFLFILHHRREKAAKLTQETIEWLNGMGHEGVILDRDAQATGLIRWGVPHVTDLHIDLAVSVGGDGTMLRAFELVCPRDIPVLGVNVGHLGYLTEVEPEQLQDALQQFLLGDYRFEERMTLEVGVSAHTSQGSGVDDDVEGTTLSLARKSAINDVVVEKRTSGHTVRLEAIINGSPF